MAKKTKHHGKRRHRRVGALSLGSSGSLLTLAAAAGGFVFADKINPIVDKIVTPTATNQTMVGAIQTGAGLGTALYLAKKTRGPVKMIAQVGGGLAAGAGAKRLLKAMGVVSGYQSVPVIGRRHVSGYQSVPVIGGPTPSQLQGMRPGQLQGYKVNGYRPHGSGVSGMMTPGIAAAMPAGATHR